MKNYFYITFCLLLLVNLNSHCDAQAVTINEVYPLEEKSKCKDKECASMCGENEADCHEGSQTMLEQPVFHFVEDENFENSTEHHQNSTDDATTLSSLVYVGQDSLTNESTIFPSTTDYDRSANETTTIPNFEDEVIHVYYSTFDNDSDVSYLNDTAVNDLEEMENSTLIEYLPDDNNTDVNSTTEGTDMDNEFTTVNSTDEALLLVLNSTENENLNTTEHEEMETTEHVNLDTTTESENATDVEDVMTTVEPVDNLTIASTEEEVSTTTEIVEIISSDNSTDNTNTTAYITDESSTNGSAEPENSAIMSENMTSGTAEVTSEDIDKINASLQTSSDEENNEKKLKLFIPIGVVGIVVLVGFIAYFLVRKMKKTATYQCEPYS